MFGQVSVRLFYLYIMRVIEVYENIDERNHHDLSATKGLGIGLLVVGVLGLSIQAIVIQTWDIT